ncbi:MULTISPECIES: co-chaperone HscB [unclassified Agarivorans]|uniref:co-chaperone HscB n=1 Tax=unclassified Agarivorans TaxID=2636026 RepID=UPI0010F83934|nr:MULTISPECIES: co-chaperone HscB [unclassified Agarivorans]MDO6687324.1 co-chaperone HscB [Agarivorans sp. 3_MG-2023]MDO6716982.1 co-chaperone HscB [Agarivorans sp. 2_MG-2023]MDO6765072.1 co-chaperone HscB [Agarivorans sp. 1_MG-2023]
MNHFELFSLRPSYQLDLQGLADCYRELQQKYHPDNFAADASENQAQVMQKAAQINDAYQTLKDPLSRAQYLLSLQDIELGGEQQTINDIEFLMAQMELREQLAEIENAADPEQALEDFSKLLKQQRSDLSSSFEKAYNEQNFTFAADQVRKLKFYARLQQQLLQLEEKILDY